MIKGIIEYFLKSECRFYWTGSCLFGDLTPASNINLFVEDDVGLINFLEKLGFKKMKNIPDYHDVVTSVYCLHFGYIFWRIEVNIIEPESFNLMVHVNDYISRYGSIQRTIPKSRRVEYWNFLISMLKEF